MSTTINCTLLMYDPGYLVVLMQIDAVSKTRKTRNNIPDRFSQTVTCLTDVDCTIFEDIFPIVIRHENLSIIT